MKTRHRVQNGILRLVANFVSIRGKGAESLAHYREGPFIKICIKFLLESMFNVKMV